MTQNFRVHVRPTEGVMSRYEVRSAGRVVLTSIDPNLSDCPLGSPYRPMAGGWIQVYHRIRHIRRMDRPVMGYPFMLFPILGSKYACMYTSRSVFLCCSMRINMEVILWGDAQPFTLAIWFQVRLALTISVAAYVLIATGVDAVIGAPYRVAPRCRPDPQSTSSTSAPAHLELPFKTRSLRFFSNPLYASHTHFTYPTSFVRRNATSR